MKVSKENIRRFLLVVGISLTLSGCGMLSDCGYGSSKKRKLP